MKKQFGAVLGFLFALLLVLTTGVFAASDILMEDFEGIPALADWTLVPKAGTVTVAGTGNRYAQINIPYVQGTDSDAYMQYGTVDGSQGVEVAGSMTLLSSAGTIQMVLRDTSGTLDGHYIRLATLENNKITFLPDAADLRVSETASVNTEYRIRVTIDPSADVIKIYCNNALKMNVANFSTVRDGYWSGFLYQSFWLRMQAARSGTVAAMAKLDNIRISRIPDADETLFCWMEGLTYGEGSEVYATASFAALSGGAQVQTVACVLRDGQMQDLWMSDSITLQESEVKRIKVPLNQQSFAWGDTVKIMAIDSLENIKPIIEVYLHQIGGGVEEGPVTPEVLDLRLKLNNQHPRVMATAQQFDALRAEISTASVRADWYQSVKARAVGYLTAALPTYEDEDALRLTASGTVLSRVWDMALVYQMTGEEQYAQKIWEYMQTCASWPDWGDNHFLNTAELCTAVGIAYDWLFDYWTVQQRDVIAQALMKNGLSKAYLGYQNKLAWTKLDSNWAAVCNGGVAVGAIALMGEEALADEVLALSMKHIQQFYIQFVPDGGWYEGVGYWHYAMQFWAYAMSAMETAFGTDFGHHLTPGLQSSTYFPIYLTGGKNIFNYSDASASPVQTNEMFYLANVFHDPFVSGFRYYQLVTERMYPAVTDLLWYDDENMSLDFRTELPGNIYYQNIETVVMRKQFLNLTSSAFVLHGGKNNISHAHLDAGQFMYEAGGVRWALDLGSESYNLYGQSIMEENGNGGKNHWAYYRNRAEGHNVPVVNPTAQADQAVSGYAVVEKHSFLDTGKSMAVMDLSPAYSGRTASVKRGAKYNPVNGGVLIQDELDFSANSQWYWFLHTTASVALAGDGRSAILTAKNDSGETKRLWVGLLTPGGSFTVMDAVPLPQSPNPDLWPENQAHSGSSVNPKTQSANTGVRKLTVHHTEAGNSAVQAVYMVLLNEGESAPSFMEPVLPLEQW